MGLLATNSIAQVNTREVGLEQLAVQGFSIYRAVPSRPWPGTAALEVAHVWLRHGQWTGQYVLDEQLVPGISSLLGISRAGEASTGGVLVAESGSAYHLVANEGKSFKGVFVLGMGFVLEPEEAKALIEKDPRNKDVLFPYLNGEDLNSRPDQSPSRWVINFFDWPLEKAENYPDCMAITREKVLPERQRKNPDGTYVLRKPLPQRWWQYADKRPELHATIAGMRRVLVIPRVSKYLMCVWVATGVIYSDATNVIATEDYTDLAVIQSTLHENWARLNGSTLETRMRYTNVDCFETFPFPESAAGLEEIGEWYYNERQGIMQRRQEGLTKTYNRFHDPNERSQDIATLRELHAEMDRAVAKAYGWSDLDLGHGFHQTKQGLRFTISEAARQEALGRLLALNHQRYAEEEALGLHDKGGKGKKSRAAPTPAGGDAGATKSAKAEAKVAAPGLFDEEA